MGEHLGSPLPQDVDDRIGFAVYPRARVKRFRPEKPTPEHRPQDECLLDGAEFVEHRFEFIVCHGFDSIRRDFFRWARSHLTRVIARISSWSSADRSFSMEAVASTTGLNLGRSVSVARPAIAKT